MSQANQPIALFDSGIGGLSVWRHVRNQLPHESIIYFADQAHLPYGPRPASEIRFFSEQIARFLQSQPAKLIVVACNTATAAALNHLRQTFPDFPFVGMEPAVKPAALNTNSGVVGVLARPGTFASSRYLRLTQQYAQKIRVLEDPCLGLVELIEQGEMAGDKTAVLLQRIVQPMLAAGADTIVLGCTHYPFIQPLLRQLVGPAVNIIDPAPAVARQTVRLLTELDLLAPVNSPVADRFISSGDRASFTQQLARMAGLAVTPETAVWHNQQLHLDDRPIQV